VALRLSFDTTFLIDLQRERSRSEPDGAAHRFLKRSADDAADLATPGRQRPSFRAGACLMPADLFRLRP
jgi:hypothetical protein